MPSDYEIRNGDCVDSIAYQHGFFPDTLWNHPSNAELKQLRKDPNVLFPGDKLVIPDLETKEVDKATDAKHRFRRKGVPAKLRLRFLKPKDPPPPKEDSGAGNDDPSKYVEPEPQPANQEMEPIANAAYRLEIDGKVTEGKSDRDGQVKVSIPPNASRGVITFYPGKPEERAIPLLLGDMDPVDTVTGARKRLRNLGYQCTTAEQELTPELREVIGQFQKDNNLTVNGELDSSTKDKLKEKHGC